MADTKISAFTDGVTAAATDRLAAARSPFGSGDNRYLTPAYIKDYILGLANTWVGVQSIASGASVDIYRTSDQVTNYERMRLGVTGTTFYIAADWAGTGVPRELRFGIGPGNLSWGLDTSSHFLPGVDNIYDLGSAGQRVRNIYAGTAFILADGVTAPSATVGFAKIYVDTADGDLKVIFGDGTIKTIVTDT